MTVVGVSADLDEPTRTYRGDTFVFVPWAQRYEPGVPVVLTVRGRSPAAAVGILRSTIRRVDPELATSTVGTGRTMLQGPLFILRIIRGLATALASISMVLAMAGLFGVLSHVVLRRMREMGIRIALGADRGRIFRLILFDGMRPVAKGIVLGLVIGVGARLAVRAWVVTDISAFEPLVLVVVPIPFVVAALVACYLPAARASRVDPNVALRDL
jgi:putative ABC transport system permease protein